MSFFYADSNSSVINTFFLGNFLGRVTSGAFFSALHNSIILMNFCTYPVSTLNVVGWESIFTSTSEASFEGVCVSTISNFLFQDI